MTERDSSSLELTWIGTAVYLYGQASSASYTVEVDGTSFTSSSVTVQPGGLLGSKTDLSYGNHTVKLTTHGSNAVAFQSAQLTIGMGYNGSRCNRTILAVEPDNTTPNSFFRYQSIQGPNSWRVEGLNVSELQPDGSTIILPRQMVTNTAGESVSFTLQNATAFFLYGADNLDHGSKTVSVTPSSNPSEARTALINDQSSALDFRQILYWESGLNRDDTYTIEITEVGGTAFSFSSLDILDGGPVPPPGSSSSPGAQTSSGSSPTFPQDPQGAGSGQTSEQKKLSAGAIGGIAAAGAVVLLLLGAIAALLLLRRRRRRAEYMPTRHNPPILPDDTSDDNLLRMQHVAPSATEVPMIASSTHNSLRMQHAGPSAVEVPMTTSSADASFTREVDAGPMNMASLPPQYETSWVDGRVVSVPIPSSAPPPDPSPFSDSSRVPDSSYAPESPTTRSPPSSQDAPSNEKRRQLVVLTYDTDPVSTA
ncbi:hypothetical protein EIP91_009290 [Steccherinum ochraceum]|uniref:Uncharacterized protein n=1 Tax=Steccherinum ochraceum TaxID=92696 RepID=A0A4V2MV33_9APHY|nr:hypothetical protein EIP91_009290 [Steccherinum ochraceum]